EGAQEARPELLAVGTVVHPLAQGGYPFSGRYAGCVTDGRNQFAMAARFDPKNTETILGVMERDALDEPRQDFLVRWHRRLHSALSRPRPWQWKPRLRRAVDYRLGVASPFSNSPSLPVRCPQQRPKQASKSKGGIHESALVPQCRLADNVPTHTVGHRQQAAPRVTDTPDRTHRVAA